MTCLQEGKRPHDKKDQMLYAKVDNRLANAKEKTKDPQELRFMLLVPTSRMQRLPRRREYVELKIKELAMVATTREVTSIYTMSPWP